MRRARATDPEGRSPDSGAERRLLLVISAVMFVDTMFYAVIAPLLPGLAHELRLSKLSAGLMTASYPIGTLLGSLPGGVLSVRAGPRFTVCLGLALLGCSTIAFGVLHDAAALDLARFVEGAGGACSWAGGLTWIVAETPASRRGAMMGRALAAAIGGALLGPALGTIATATGRPAAFGAVAFVAGLLIVATRGLPSHHAASEQGLGSLAAVLGKPGVAAGVWLLVLPAVASGVLGVLGPLRLHRFGAPAVVVGVTFLVAAAVETVIAPIAGRLSDRRGRLAPLRYGLAAATATLCCFTLPRGVAPLAAVIVVIAAALGMFWAPAMAMLSDAAEAHGLDQGLAAALMNMAWAGGQIIGSGGGGAVAKAAGDAAPVAAVAGLCAATLVGLARARRSGHRRILAPSEPILRRATPVDETAPRGRECPAGIRTANHSPASPAASREVDAGD